MKSEKSKLAEGTMPGIVVVSLGEAIAIFTELGRTLEGRAMIEGEGRVASPDLAISVSRSP